MLHVGLDLGGKRLEVCVLDESAERVSVTTATPDGGGLGDLVGRVATLG